MATRFYLAAATVSDAVTPAFAAAWTNTTSAARRLLSTALDGADTLASVGAQTWTAGQLRLSRQFISGPMRAGQTLSGTVTAYARVLESNADDNAVSRLGVFVFSADGTTLRATLLAVGNYGTSNEFATTNTNRRWASASAIPTPYVTQAGDRVVVEFGYTDATGTTPSANAIYGRSGGADLPQNETDTSSSNPWIEFSATITLLDGGITGTVEHGPDTIFYGEASTPTPTQLATDLSGQLTNMTINAADVTETSSARFNLTGTAAWEFIVNASNTANGSIYTYNSTTVQVQIVTGWILRLRINNATVGDITLNDSSTRARRVLICVSMEPNPLTTGASDAKRYEVLAYMPSSAGSIQRDVFLGPAPSGTAGTALINVTASNISTHCARISRAFHSTTHFRRTFIEVASPTITHEERLEQPVPVLSSGEGDDGRFAGPVHMFAGSNLRTTDLRLWGPIVNDVFDGITAAWPTTYFAGDEPSTPNVDTFANALYRRPLPPACNRVRVRVYVTITAGEVEITAYSANAPGHLALVPPGGYVLYTSTPTATTTSGWISLGMTAVARDADGYGYFWLGVEDINPVSTYRVSAFEVEPVQITDEDAPGEGFGFG